MADIVGHMDLIIEDAGALLNVSRGEPEDYNPHEATQRMVDPNA